MTISNSKSITVPVYLLNIIVSVITAAFIVWAGISVNNVRITRAEKDIELKADKEEINRIYKILDEIKVDIKSLRDDK